jgi:hypothetical protein
VQLTAGSKPDSQNIEIREFLRTDATVITGDMGSKSNVKSR